MKYTVTYDGDPDIFESRATVGDIVKYEINFTPWLEGKGSISSTVWSVVCGDVSIDDTDQEALITFNSASRSVVSCVVTTSTGEKKKIWLIIKATTLCDYS